MAHVFIVDEKTFDIHLKYNFAGTGAKESDGIYLFDNSIEIKASTERTITGLLADISRIREGDKILFYLQQKNGREGMFFGSFQADGRAFLCVDKYLDDELGKKLIFRIKIKPNNVYSKGATERECLDTLEGIKYPYELCWSLIYRKLKGNRGCTMITDAEYEFIMNKIKMNNKQPLNSCKNYQFEPILSCIIECDNELKYEGSENNVNIFSRLKYKADKKNAYETHLQAYLMQSLESINLLKVNNAPINWIGNEMSCGVGMQSIDVIFMQETNKMHIVICELKDEQPEEYIKNQINKYIDWISQFIAPTMKKEVVIHPTIVAPNAKNKTIEMLKKIDIMNFEKRKNVAIDDTRYISFVISDNNLEFKKEEI